jgi:DNA-binding NarL/FixJ family response regulator
MRILIVDDHAPTRNEMCLLLARDPEMSVVAAVGTGEDAVTEARARRPDIVIMDILLPGINGIQATKAIRAELPETKVLALSNHSGRRLIDALLVAGGSGYVRKDRAFEELIPALRAVAAGQRFLGEGAEH